MTAGFFAALGWDTAAPVLARFPDRGQISTWARNAAAAAVELEIVAGNTDGTVAPQQNSNCEQTLAMLLRAYRYLEKLLGKTGRAACALHSPKITPALPGQQRRWPPSMGLACFRRSCRRRT